MAVTHEKTDVTASGVIWGGLIIAAAVAVAFWAMWVLLGALVAKEQAASAPAHPLSATMARKEPPAPRLQASPRDDLLALRAEEDALLGTYGWVDEERRVVRIPIDRAMELLVERGLPSRPGGSR